MKSIKKRLLGPLTLLVAATAVSSSAFAWQVNISNGGLPNGATEVAGSAVFDARYKMDTTNWDTALISGGTVNSNTMMSRNLSNSLSALSGKEWEFTLQYQSGMGYIMKLDDGTTSYAFSWGTGIPNSTYTMATTTLDDGTGTQVGPDRAYNAILIRAQATANNSYAQFSNLNFSSTATVSGALANGYVNTGTATGSGTNHGTTYEQWILADTNLAEQDWTLTGKVTLYAESGNPKEALKFDVYGKTLSVVPEPGSIAIAALGAIGFLGYGIRRRMKRS